ncbi:unnamed protein product, partial [Porites evermanni]
HWTFSFSNNSRFTRENVLFLRLIPIQKAVYLQQLKEMQSSKQVTKASKNAQVNILLLEGEGREDYQL